MNFFMKTTAQVAKNYLDDEVRKAGTEYTEFWLLR